MYLLPDTLKCLEYSSKFDEPPSQPVDFHHSRRLTALTALTLFGLERCRNLNAIWELPLLYLEIDRCCLLEMDLLVPGVLQSLRTLRINPGRRVCFHMETGYYHIYTGCEEQFLARLQGLRSVIAALPDLKELYWRDDFIPNPL